MDSTVTLQMSWITVQGEKNGAVLWQLVEEDKAGQVYYTVNYTNQSATSWGTPLNDGQGSNGSDEKCRFGLSPNQSIVQ